MNGNSLSGQRTTESPKTGTESFIVGVRSDLEVEPRLLAKSTSVQTCRDAIGNLPPLRSGLTRTKDSYDNWKNVFSNISESDWYAEEEYSEVAEEIRSVLEAGFRPEHGTGSEFCAERRASGNKSRYEQWVVDSSIGGFCNHASKSHMQDDLLRYLFLACKRRLDSDQTSKLQDLPNALLPKHKNASAKLLANGGKAAKFIDRFFVQAFDKPARTIVSHIAKDGHGFTYPDPKQARTLTVREAARLQTFPDDFFSWTQSEQYKQVGNAVPPLLSRQIAEIVNEILEKVRASMTTRSSVKRPQLLLTPDSRRLVGALRQIGYAHRAISCRFGRQFHMPATNVLIRRHDRGSHTPYCGG